MKHPKKKPAGFEKRLQLLGRFFPDIDEIVNGPLNRYSRNEYGLVFVIPDADWVYSKLREVIEANLHTALSGNCAHPSGGVCGAHRCTLGQLRSGQ